MFSLRVATSDEDLGREGVNRGHGEGRCVEGGWGGKRTGERAGRCEGGK